MIRRTTCKKCKSTNISITWRYAKKDEMAMYLCHDGWGFLFEDAIMKCAKCGSKKLSNYAYNNKGEMMNNEN